MTTTDAWREGLALDIRDDSLMAARVAYAAYGTATGWLTHDGRRMPAFDDLGDAVILAWRRAATAAGHRAADVHVLPRAELRISELRRRIAALEADVADAEKVPCKSCRGE